MKEKSKIYNNNIRKSEKDISGLQYRSFDRLLFGFSFLVMYVIVTTE